MLLFLSHSSVDGEAAAELKRRILASPAAQAAGLRVWLDRHDLDAGRPFQPQLEKAIAEATAFCVYVGTKRIVNWVEREVRQGLERATGPDAIPFIPILGPGITDPTSLPPFARQFHAVRNPLGDEEQLARLVRAATGYDEAPPVLTDEPFVGLRAMTEVEADRFFGRDDEIAALVAMLGRHPLVAIVADSGAGKSSLARAGLAHAFCGGALEPEGRLREQPHARLVVTMRPGRDPVQGLKNGIDRAARELALDAEARAGLRRRVDPIDAGETAHALRCDLDPESTEVLLIVDQFEELLTQTRRADADQFVALLAALVENEAPRAVRVVLTVRADYYNLLRRHQALFDRLEADGRAAQLRLKGLTEDGLADAVRRPLAMAGHRDTQEQEALLKAIRRDVSDRAGDVALVQMALYATWRAARMRRADLLRAYAEVGGVLGAVAHEAERVRETVLGEDEQALLLPLLARLVRLGDTAGATRRIAALAEFDTARAALARKLATEEAGRLLVVGEETVEIAHEALVTQWPWLQEQVQTHSPDIRALARLGDKAAAWEAAGQTSAALPNKAEMVAWRDLVRRRPGWPSETERAVVAAAEGRARRVVFAGVAAISLIVAFGIAASFFGLWARSAEERAVVEARLARTNEVGALSALSEVQLKRGFPVEAAKLALAAWPRNGEDDRPQLPAVLRALSAAVVNLHARVQLGNELGLNHSVAFSRDGAHLITVTNAGAVLWDIKTGRLRERLVWPGINNVIAHSPDGRRLVALADGTVQLFDTQSRDVARLGSPAGTFSIAAFSLDGTRVAIGSDTSIDIWNLENEPEITLIKALPIGAEVAAVSPDGKYVAYVDGAGAIIIWSIDAGRVLRKFFEHTDSIYDVQFSADGAWLAIGFSDGIVRVREVLGKQNYNIFSKRIAAEYKLVFPEYKFAVLPMGGTSPPRRVSTMR